MDRARSATSRGSELRTVGGSARRRISLSGPAPGILPTMRVVVALAASLLAGCGQASPTEPAAAVPAGPAKAAAEASAKAATEASVKTAAEASVKAATEAPSRVVEVVECQVTLRDSASDDEK